MKIAFISYEYPPDTAYGGIATYVRQAALMLSQRGHSVEVFCASEHRDGTETEENILVHRILQKNRDDFFQSIGKVFQARHKIIQFDVLEGPDCGADAAGAVKLVPDIPLVLKLHTPKYVLGSICGVPLNWADKTRMILGAIRRGKLPDLPKVQPYNPKSDPEYLHALEADEIVAPSLAIGQKVTGDWGLEPDKVIHVPLPYIPAPELLSIPIETRTSVITFLGRLEIRKGILDLADAIPQILQKFPLTKFRFVGPAWPSPKHGLDMQQYLEKKLSRYSHSLEFVGRISLNQIPFYLAITDICVFPSIWENFPLVCLESMAAGRAIVASSAGGMRELLNNGEVGLLVPPRSPKQIATAINKLLADSQFRMNLGQAARERVLTEYNLERIATLQEASYLRAIKLRQQLGTR